MTTTLYDTNLFRAVEDMDDRIATFKAHVENVIIETSSHCNRRCSFCPSWRRQGQHYMDDGLFESIVEQLASIEYDNMICTQFYNEPLADSHHLLRAIAVLRNRLPAARVYFSTNGDFLNHQILDELSTLGVSFVTISVHPKGVYSDVAQLDAMYALARRIGLRLRFDKVSAGSIMRATARHGGLDVIARSTNFDRHGVNRGGLLGHIQSPADRRSPCYRSFHDFGIAFDGTVFPCCNFVAGIAEHERYVIHKLTPETSIFDIYTGGALAGWRRRLFTQGPKPTPCDSCGMSDIDIDSAESLRRVHFLAELDGVGRNAPM